MAAKEPEQTSTIISKLSVKTVKSDPKEAVRQNKSVALAQFWGIAEAVKYVVNRQTGDTNTALIGTFRAVNIATGERFESGVLYLPAGIHDQLTAPLIRAKDTTPEPISFAIEVSAVPASNPVGYSYTGKALRKPQGIDVLAELESELSGRLALPSPQKAKA